jgi:hypothetical protein
MTKHQKIFPNNHSPIGYIGVENFILRHECL